MIGLLNIPNQPADVTRDAFKLAISRHIDQLNMDSMQVSGPVVCQSADFSTLSKLHAGLMSGIINELATFINYLMPMNGQLLAQTVVVGGYNQPKDHTQDAFREALIIGFGL